eukprot:SAG11_NODE_3055_length_2725_cov_1.795126_1_plen_198_part_10
MRQERAPAERQQSLRRSQVEADEQTARAATLVAEARAAPSPPLCAGGASACKMVASAQANTYFYGDFYSPANSSAETSLKACEAACIADAKCVAMTFSVRPNDPCELYSLVTRRVIPSSDTVVALKCKTADAKKGALSCGHFSAARPTPPGPPPGPALPPGIRYHALMEGVQEHPNNGNTCCEGQGTRLFGSMPEYFY